MALLIPVSLSAFCAAPQPTEAHHRFIKVIRFIFMFSVIDVGIKYASADRPFRLLVALNAFYLGITAFMHIEYAYHIGSFGFLISNFALNSYFLLSKTWGMPYVLSWIYGSVFYAVATTFLMRSLQAVTPTDGEMLAPILPLILDQRLSLPGGNPRGIMPSDFCGDSCTLIQARYVRESGVDPKAYLACA